MVINYFSCDYFVIKYGFDRYHKHVYLFTHSFKYEYIYTCIHTTHEYCHFYDIYSYFISIENVDKARKTGKKARRTYEARLERRAIENNQLETFDEYLD